jgi:three-Cys-motif partner protein
MATPRTTVWELDEHSKGKHIVLKRYLQAWLAILGTTHARIAIIDGFAGPGEYTGGEEGSPIIALRALADHIAPISARVAFWFIEADADRAEHLEKLVAPFRQSLATRATITVSRGTFDEQLTGVLTDDEEKKLSLIPAFVMVDPFGVSHTPMSVISQILKNQKSEVYISFMTDWIDRFKQEPGFEQHLDDLFGRAEWRHSMDLATPKERRAFLFPLYAECLKKAGAKYVVHFDLRRGATVVYSIFFATGSDVGCDKMKEAIWKADPTAGSAFIPANESALDLFTKDVSRLEQEIIAYLKQSPEWIAIWRLEVWARSDQTHYHSGQLKPALKSLEKKGVIDVRAESRKIRFTFPKGTVLRLSASAG